MAKIPSFLFELPLSLHDGVPCVVNRVGFIVSAVVGDALDDYFGIIPTGKGALRIGPIAFGLAFVVARHRPLPLLVFAKVTWGFR